MKITELKTNWGVLPAALVIFLDFIVIVAFIFTEKNPRRKRSTFNIRCHQVIIKIRPQRKNITRKTAIRIPSIGSGKSGAWCAFGS